MRLALTLSAIAGLAIPAFAEPPAQEMETYRYGGSYRVGLAATPASCANACAGDTRCLAWSYDTNAASPGLCELKSAYGRAEARYGAISGISPRHVSLYPAVAEGFAVTPQAPETSVRMRSALGEDGRRAVPLPGASSIEFRRPAPLTPQTGTPVAAAPPAPGDLAGGEPASPDYYPGRGDGAAFSPQPAATDSLRASSVPVG